MSGVKTRYYELNCTRMNFCREKRSNLWFLSALLLSLIAVSLASRAGALTSLEQGLERAQNSGQHSLQTRLVLDLLP